MKKFFTLLLFVFVAVHMSAQSSDVFISVAMPSNSVLDNNTKTILKNKLLAICTIEGVAATECGAIAMVPEVAVLDEQLVEGGLRNIRTIEISINVSVRNIITNTVFNTLTITSKGEGYSMQESLRAAIKKINVQNYINFAQATKKKVEDYYSSNAANLIKKANTLSAQQQYDEAIALLTTFPESLADYSRVSAAIQNIYQQYLSQNCEEIMMMAQAEYAKRSFEKAADLAATVDPSSSCYNSAKSLLSSIKKDNDKIYQNEIEKERQEQRTRERITIAKVNAARDVAVAYFKRKSNYIFFW